MNKVLGGFLALAVVGLVFAGFAVADAENPDKKGPRINSEVHDQLIAAVESGNYSEWVQVFEDNDLPMQGKMFSAISEDNFHLLTELHEARAAQDFERAKEIHEELGIGKGHHGCNGAGVGNKHPGFHPSQDSDDAGNDGQHGNFPKVRGRL